MDRGGSFACPECGAELALKGTTAGRQIRCGWCETWVEIPFLPRAVAPRARFARGRARRPAWVVWAWGGVAVLAVLVATFGANRWVRVRSRIRAEQKLAVLMAEAEAAENEGRFDEAVAAIQGAVRESGRAGSPVKDRQPELQQRRDELVRHAAEVEIEAAGRAEPAAAVAVYKGLLARIWRDAALEDLEGPLRERLERTRRQWAEADLAVARQAAQAGRCHEALDACERLFGTAEELGPPAHDSFQTEADAIVTGLVALRGVVFSPPAGEFTLGSPQSYGATLERLMGPVLRQHGYLPPRSASRWKALWETRAPYRIAAQVVERQTGSYLNSGNRPSNLALDVSLAGGETTVWRSGPLRAQTQPSIPTLSAFTSSRLVIDSSRRVEAERLLYDDARAQLEERFNGTLRKLPDFRPLAP